MASKDLATKDFTPRELEIMAKAWNCMTEEPKVDYDRLAELTGMTNPRSASNAWANIKKKILAKGGQSKGGDGDDGDCTKSPTTKSTPGKSAVKRGRGKAINRDDDDDAPTPSKKAKSATKKGKKYDDDDGTVKPDPDENPFY